MTSNRLQECLSGKTGNYIIPLLWYNGEDTEKIEREMHAIQAAGIREFILENRGGDWFCTDRWWEIFGFTLKKAEEMGMRVWLLDDSHVNTGSANDSLKLKENARFRPQNLRIEIMDLAGPVRVGAAILPQLTEQEKILQITAYERDENSGVCIGNPVDLTDNVRDGICLLDLPDGIWRIFFIMTADPAKQGLFANYITMVSRESCRHLIDEVHEKIYAHFAPYFGNTFAGFFSDEPAFGNCDGQYGYDMANHRMGQLRRLYPWWDDFPRRLAAKTGVNEIKIMQILPALWDNVKDVSPSLRLAYMDLITELWRENYSRQLGKWCEAHNVRYIGHNLEDEGSHMRTGWGCGHYFRSVAGQHMAGIDIVLVQMIPGITTVPHMLNSGYRVKETKFYQYTLGKLASSMAHITPSMENRSICEIFGAYGWTAGLPIMRALLNHFLTDGVNHYIPHAYSMVEPKVFKKVAERELKDDSFVPPGYCMDYLPPSFYAGGFNPQYKIFCELMKYTQRVCHLLTSGTHRADVALYYCAEVDWMNAGAQQNLDDVTAALIRSGFDFDLLPADALIQECRVENGCLKVAEEQYGALIVPSAEVYPEFLLRRFSEFAKAGVPVIFSGALPERCEQSQKDISVYLSCFENVAQESLTSLLEKRVDLPLTFVPRHAELRHFVLEHADGTMCCLLHNESRKTLDFSVSYSGKQQCVVYDPWRNKAYRGVCEEKGCKLHLESQQMLIVFFGMNSEDLPVYEPESPCLRKLVLHYDISIRDAGETGEFRLLRKNSEAVNLIRAENMTRYCGEFRYESDFECQAPATLRFLTIPECGDCAELWINDEYCGAELGPLCRFDIRGKMKKGRNRLCIQTADSPAFADRSSGTDGVSFGAGLPLTKHGFTGYIFIG